MALRVQTQISGDVFILLCNGRIVFGDDALLREKIVNMLPGAPTNLYMTEQSVTARLGEGPLGIAEPVRRVMIGATRNWSRNILLWNLAADPQNGPHTNNGGCTGCSGAITLDGDSVTKNVACYVVEHFSQFVPPGSVRVASSEMEQLASVAFLTPEGKVALVVSNTGNFPKSFAVKYHGKVFQTTMPAESVGTYVW